MRTREKEVFFLNTLKISLAQPSPRRTFSGDVLRGLSSVKKQKKLNTRKRKGQDATKITSAPAESCIQFPWSVMPISMSAADLEGEETFPIETQSTKFTE